MSGGRYPFGQGAGNLNPRTESVLNLSRPLRPVPIPSLRPWAGSRLGAGVGEVWVAGPGSLVALPDGSTSTLDGLTASAGEQLVGSAGIAAVGLRFPLLAKLIDSSEWLSLQVHPDDALARRLMGERALGKDEVWVVLEVDATTRLVTGPARHLDAGDVAAAVAAGTMDLDACDLRRPTPGDTLNIRAGTIHAIGPGAFVYELEQPSDLTFRISDWGRPATPGRHLHLDEARQAIVPAQHAELVGEAWALDGGALNQPHFRLELVVSGSGSDRTPNGRSPEIVTAVGGTVILRGSGWSERLAALETAVVPAAVPRYTIATAAGAIGVVGSLPL